MEHIPTELLSRVKTWPAPAQTAFSTLRGLGHAAANDLEIGPLEESLKWGQPAWRPVKPNTGSTMRVMWN